MFIVYACGKAALIEIAVPSSNSGNAYTLGIVRFEKRDVQMQKNTLERTNACNLWSSLRFGIRAVFKHLSVFYTYGARENYKLF